MSLCSEGHYADCHNAESPYAEIYYAECHYAAYQVAKCHFAESHYTECCGTVPIIFICIVCQLFLIKSTLSYLTL